MRESVFVIYKLLAWMICVCCISACDLIVPPDRPLPEKRVLPDDFVFERIDLLDYDYIGVTRIDCQKVVSELTSTGRCLPHKSPRGHTVRCPLAEPFLTLEAGCLTSDPVSAVYVDLAWAPQAKGIRLPEALGTCHVEEAGPAAGRPSRYATDSGYRACLFDAPDGQAGGRLSADDETARPIGLYADLTDAAEGAEPGTFDGALHVILDARYFDEQERETAWRTLPLILNLYRDPATIRTDTRARSAAAGEPAAEAPAADTPK